MTKNPDPSAPWPDREADADERLGTIISPTSLPDAAEPPTVAAAVDPSTYVELLSRSELIAAEQLDHLLAVYRARSDLDLSLPDFIAGSGKITPWQHARLRAGQWQFEVGGCTLIDCLGSGAMSDVYLGLDSLTGSHLAIKILKSRHRQNGSIVERFRMEGATMRRLAHRNLLRCLRMGQSAEDWFLVLEYLRGRDVSTLVTRQGLCSFELAADIIRQAGNGLHYLHQRRIVHRDIKPGNLFLNLEGVVKILDLGLARVPTEEGQSLTALHRETVLGTPDFIAPEQVLACHEVDGRADLYALGGTFYYLLTGHAPFAEGSIAKRLLKHQQESPESICFFRPNTPAPLVEICRRLLAKHPEDRFSSAAELSATLARWLKERGAPSAVEAGQAPQRADARDDFDALARWSGCHE